MGCSEHASASTPDHHYLSTRRHAAPLRHVTELFSSVSASIHAPRTGIDDRNASKVAKTLRWTRTRRASGIGVAEAMGEIAEPTYPKYPVLVVIQRVGNRSLVVKRWGVPVTIKGASGKPLTKFVANSRSDKLLIPWRYATAERRCLIPAAGYDEPGSGPEGAKGLILFTVRDRPMFFFAGRWEDEAFSMVTTEPNAFVARFHDCMPLVLADSEIEECLGDTPLPDDRLLSLCPGLALRSAGTSRTAAQTDDHPPRAGNSAASGARTPVARIS